MPFALVVFVLGCAMGVGKAAVYKHIPDYFPDNVGPVGGLVGMLGGLGGFSCPHFCLHKGLVGLPVEHLLRALHLDRDLPGLDALDRRTHVARRLP
ncbi:MAG: hypothetical protein R2709_10225 [Marmoricola sp.]